MPVDRKTLVALNLIGFLCGLCLAQNVSSAQPFSLTLPPDFQVTVGSQIWTYVAAEVVADSGFTGTVQVSVSGVPSGVTVPQAAFPLVFAAGGPYPANLCPLSGGVEFAGFGEDFDEPIRELIETMSGRAVRQRATEHLNGVLGEQ
jgi:hypothetical protein